MSKHRTLVRVEDALQSGHLVAVIPAWHPTLHIYVDFNEVPEEILGAIVDLPFRLYARANLDGKTIRELDLSDWEIANEE